MKKLILLPLLVMGCSQAKDLSKVPKRLSDDFFVTVAKAGHVLPKAAVLQVAPGADPASCEANLRKAVCETNATTDQITNEYHSISCANDSAKYVPALMEIYNEMPEKMRISLCTLERVFISDGIQSTAFASSVTDDVGSITGGYIGMRKGTFLSQPTSAQIVSWKEQLAYGGSTTFLSNDPKLVQINYNLKMSVLKSDGLFYVLMHELGHLIDFNNHVNSPEGADSDWSRLSWDNPQAPLMDDSFEHRDDFCFYNCSQYLSPADAGAIYTSLSKSAFVTTYASSNPYEDFAENWAWHMMELYKNPDYQIVVPGQTTVDMNQVFKSNPKIQKKIEFVDQLWNNPSLKIDNRP